MNTPSPAPAEDALLAELGWVQRLARSLVQDVATADDVAQEACLAALQSPPRQEHGRASLRAWLATVTRTLARTHARGERRRHHREELAARVDRDDSDLNNELK